MINDCTEFLLNVFIVKIFRDISEGNLVMVFVLGQGWKNIVKKKKQLNTQIIARF